MGINVTQTLNAEDLDKVLERMAKTGVKFTVNADDKKVTQSVVIESIDSKDRVELVRENYGNTFVARHNKNDEVTAYRTTIFSDSLVGKRAAALGLPLVRMYRYPSDSHEAKKDTEKFIRTLCPDEGQEDKFSIVQIDERDIAGGTEVLREKPVDFEDMPF